MKKPKKAHRALDAGLQAGTLKPHDEPRVGQTAPPESEETTLGRDLALRSAWWAWDHPRTRKAVGVGLLEHLGSTLNISSGPKGQRGISATCETLANYLRRNPRNVSRVMRGESAFTHELLLGLASALQKTVAELFPSTQAWIGSAACSLCGGAVGPEQGKAYAAYRLAGPVEGRERIERELLAKAYAGMKEKFKSLSEFSVAVERVVEKLGPVLARIDGEIGGRGG